MKTFYDTIKDDIMKEIWITGAGFFGSLALNRLDNGKFKFVIVDAVVKVNEAQRTVLADKIIDYYGGDLKNKKFVSQCDLI